MNIAYLAYRNMVSKPLNLLLSLLLLSLSVSLVTFVLQLNKQLSGQLNKNIAPFDMVVGAKGSPLQLVLSSVLHIDAPTGNIKLKDISMLQNHPFVDKTIPVSYGDNYKGYRILGTELEYLESYGGEIKEGRLFEKSFEVVVGNGVATRLNLSLGDTFISSHGLIDGGGEGHEDHPFEVVGILNPSGTVIDQLLISNLESIWDAHNHEDAGHTEDEHDQNEHHEHDGHGDHEHDEHDRHNQDGHDEEHAHNHDEHDDHDHEEHEHEHDEELEITSLLVKFKSQIL